MMNVMQFSIESNNIYRNSSITTGGVTSPIGLIYIESGSGYTIKGNYIGGGDAQFISSTYFTVNNANLYGIYLSGLGSKANNIYDNNVKYLSIGSSGNSVYGIYTNMSSSSFNIYNNELQIRIKRDVLYFE